MKNGGLNIYMDGFGNNVGSSKLKCTMSNGKQNLEANLAASPEASLKPGSKFQQNLEVTLGSEAWKQGLEAKPGSKPGSRT